MSSYQLENDRLAAFVRLARGSRSLRDIASEMHGMSISTLSRIERGWPTPDLSTFLELCSWLGVHPADVIRDRDADRVVSLPSTIEQVALALHADPRLDSAVADALLRVIRAVLRESIP